MSLRERFSGRRSEAGETLIEVMMSSALMGLVVVAILGGIATMLLSSHVHREQTDANAALVTGMELIKSTSVSRSCATNAYQTVSGLDSHISITSIEYETISPAGGSPAVVWSSNVSDCSLSNILSLQRITLKYTTTDGKVAPSLSFIKGDV